jgi:hypothetical protein
MSDTKNTTLRLWVWERSELRAIGGGRMTTGVSRLIHFWRHMHANRSGRSVDSEIERAAGDFGRRIARGSHRFKSYPDSAVESHVTDPDDEPL